jgi:hypothetical protein
MEILLVIVVLAVIAAAVFLWMRSRNGAPGLSSGGGPALRGRRGAARATRHDPMAEAVERHAMATDPREAAEAELQLQAQANRVAADLHAQQASALESEVGAAGGLRGHGSAMPADAYGRPASVDQYGQPAYDADGRPLYVDGQPAYQNGAPVYEDGTPVYEDGRPPVPADDGAAYYDEHGRPVFPEDRPRY